MADHPFLRPDAVGLPEIATDGAVELLTDRGIGQLTVRAIAQWMQVTPPAIYQQAPRATLLRWIIVCFGGRWLSWIRPRYGSPLPTRLPETDDELHGVRVWHALAELARGAAAAGDPDLLAAVTTVRTEERASMAHHLAVRLGRHATKAEVDTVVAVVTGLRLELAAEPPTLSSEEALAILEEVVGRISPGV